MTCMPREPLVFGEAAQADLLEQRLHLERHAPHVVPADARARVQVDAQLVGVVQVGGAHRMRMQLDAAEVDNPRQPRRVVDHDLLGRAPRRKRQRHRAQPRRPLVGRALLVERLALGAVDEALEHDRPIADAAERAVRDRQVVANQVQLGELRLLRKIGLAGMGDADLAPAHVQDLGILFLGHGAKATTSIMSDTKQDVLDMLRELAELTMLEEGDPQSFRVRAYESAAQAIAAQANDLGQLDRQGAAEDRGHRQEHRREDPRAARDRQGRRSSRRCARSTRRRVVALLRIQGLGPKAVQRLRAELGVQSIDDLRRALAEHKLRALKGFGAEVGGEAGRVAGAPRGAGRGRAHADLGRAAARRAHRRAPARRCRA